MILCMMVADSHRSTGELGANANIKNWFVARLGSLGVVLFYCVF